METVVLLRREKVDGYISVDLDIEKLSNAGGSASYSEIKAYIKENYGFNVSSLNIAQIKDKVGIKERKNHNEGREGHKVPNCTPEKEKAIMDAFRYFGMI